VAEKKTELETVNR